MLSILVRRSPKNISILERLLGAIGVSVVLFFFGTLVVGRCVKFDLLTYTSDLGITIEMAANVVEYRRLFYSSVFNNFLGVHLYWYHILEAPFVAWLGGYFYMIIAPIAALLGSACLAGIIRTRGGSPTLAWLVAGSFMANPLTLSILDQPVYGFQYDVYALAFVPLLILALSLSNSTIIVIAALAVSLAVKEEMAISACLIGFWFLFDKVRRINGLCVLVLSGLYGIVSGMTLRRFAADAYYAPTVEMAEKLERLGGLGLLEKLLVLPGSPVFSVFDRIWAEAGWGSLLALVFGGLPALPLFVFMCAVEALGVLHGTFFWKVPYFWAVAWGFAAISLAYVERRVGKGLCILPALGLAVTILKVSGSWYPAHAFYLPANLHAWTQNRIEAMSGFSTPVELTDYKARKLEVATIKSVVKDSRIVIPPEVGAHLVAEFGVRMWRKAPPDNFFIVVDHEHRHFNTDSKFDPAFLRYPVVHQTARFTVLSSVDATRQSGITGTRTEPNVFTLNVPRPGRYRISCHYSKDGRSWPTTRPSFLTIDGAREKLSVLPAPTIFQDEGRSSASFVADVTLDAGKAVLRFSSDDVLQVYGISADLLEDTL